MRYFHPSFSAKCANESRDEYDLVVVGTNDLSTLLGGACSPVLFVLNKSVPLPPIFY